MVQVQPGKAREQEEVWGEAAAGAEWAATFRDQARGEIVCALNVS